MKIRVVCFLLILISFGCKKDDKITFEPITYLGDACADCPQIKITVPRALTNAKVDKVINNALTEELIYLLNFNEENEATDIESAITSFTKGYTNLKNQFSEEATPWEATVSGAVTYEDTRIITLKLDSYLFTGGAHGYNTTHFLNFDKQKGIELDPEALFKNENEFKDYAESKFRTQEDIPSQNDINSTGFMFETGSFYLPENIGYTKKGLQLFYEQYEIASYADGPIVFTFPYQELTKFLMHAPTPD
jgi:hypothetical protein